MYEQIKENRPEVNVSQVCREALEQRVALGERAIERVSEDGMDIEVARLAQSVRNLLIEPDWVGYALDDARDWLRVVDKEKWENFLELWDEWVDLGDSPANMAGMGAGEHGVKSFFDRMREHEDWFMAQDQARNRNVSWATAMDAYNRAWMGYVAEVRIRLDPNYKG